MQLASFLTNYVVHDDICYTLELCLSILSHILNGFRFCIILLLLYFATFIHKYFLRAISVTPRGLALELESATYLHMQLYFQLVCITNMNRLLLKDFYISVDPPSPHPTSRKRY